MALEDKNPKFRYREIESKDNLTWICTWCGEHIPVGDDKSRDTLKEHEQHCSGRQMKTRDYKSFLKDIQPIPDRTRDHLAFICTWCHGTVPVGSDRTRDYLGDHEKHCAVKKQAFAPLPRPIPQNLLNPLPLIEDRFLYNETFKLPSYDNPMPDRK